MVKFSFSKLSISTKILILILLIFILIAVYQIWIILDFLNKEKEKIVSTLQDTQKVIDELIYKTAKENLKLALAIAALPEVRLSLQFDDRERLLNFMKPFVSQLQQASPYPVLVHFHKTPGISFLRLWAPDKFGDDLSYRKTVVEALKTGKPVYGIEVGLAGLEVRGIAPIFWEWEEKGKNQVIGSVEVYTHLSAVVQNIKKDLKEEAALLWLKTVNATAITQTPLKSIGRFKILVSAHEEFMSLLNEKVLQQALLAPKIYEKNSVLIQLLPVKDFAGKSVAVYVRFKDIRPLEKSLRSMLYKQIIQLLVIVLLAIGVVVLVLRLSVSRPLEKILIASDRVAQGKLDQSISYTGTAEIVKISQSLNKIILGVGEYVLTIQKGVQNLKNISNQLKSEANKLLSGSQKVQTKNNEMLNLSERVSQEIQQISKAIDQFTTAIHEIVNHVTQTSQGVEKVKERVALATNKINTLSESSRRIGEVIKVIEDLANQTNLLALNASIEAARAGEAGKGFAVVANEIKELARQTTSATENIRQIVESIQKEVESTVIAIQEVDDIVSGVSDLATQMASATEEQSAVAEDIKNNVDRGTKNVQILAQEIKLTTQVLSEFLEIASGMEELQKKLIKLAEEMEKLSNKFQVKEEVIQDLKKKLT